MHRQAKFRVIKFRVSLFFLLFLALQVVAAEEPDHEIHVELRALLNGIETAVNTEKYADLHQYFHKNLRVTTVNQNTIISYPEIDAYFKEWFGDGGYLQSLELSLEPDALTEFYNDKTMGIVRGSGVEKYELTDGRFLDLKTRWTATLIKDTDSKWRIIALHLGTNFYDNPIYHETRKYLIKMGVAGTAVAAIVGILIGFFLGRRKPTS